jgi:hypothetical protein
MMEKISAKQLDGVIDTTTAQEIEGEKTWKSPSNFHSLNPGEFVGMRIDGVFIYWLKSFERMDMDGTIRFGFDPNVNAFVMQRLQSETWENI